MNDKDEKSLRMEASLPPNMERKFCVHRFGVFRELPRVCRELTGYLPTWLGFQGIINRMKPESDHKDKTLWPFVYAAVIGFLVFTIFDVRFTRYL